MDNKINLKDAYFYGVCFVCVILFIFSIVTLSNTVIDIIYPNYQIYYPKRPELKVNYQKRYPNLSEKEINNLIQEEKKENKKRRKMNFKRRVAKDLAKGITLLILTIPIYLFHWRKIQV